MNTLPKEIENIILDYKNQLEKKYIYTYQKKTIWDMFEIKYTKKGLVKNIKKKNTFFNVETLYKKVRKNSKELKKLKENEPEILKIIKKEENIFSCKENDRIKLIFYIDYDTLIDLVKYNNC